MRVFRRIMLGGGIDIESLPDTQKLYYKATAKVSPRSGSLGSPIIKNSWDSTSGEGVIVCSKDIVRIAKSAFNSNTSLISITIPDSVTVIEDYTFNGCTGLTSITIPDSVTVIKGAPFSNCTSLPIIDNIRYADTYLVEAVDKSLTTYSIKAGTRFIGNFAFDNCSSITSLTIPNSVINIGSSVFRNCRGHLIINSPVVEKDYWNTSLLSDILYGAKFSQLTIGNDIKKIGSSKFANCTSLKSVTIGNSVTTIGEWAFSQCTSLTSINIPDSVTSISDNAFHDCTAFPITDNIRYADTYLVGAVDKSLTTYSIKEGTRFIGDEAFKDCRNLTSITIPDSVTEIGEWAFEDCTSLPIENNIRYADTYAVGVMDKTLTSYTLKENTRFIGSYAFADCASLTNITIPNSVIRIGVRAFYGCNNLKSYYGKNESEDNYCLVIGGLLCHFAQTSFTQYTIPDSVTKIGDYAFYNCSSLTNVTIPNSVTEIGKYAFAECTSLTNITIPDSVTTIGDSAFYRCRSLTSMTIGANVTTIERYATLYCSFKTVYCKSITPPTVYDYSGFATISDLYVPEESVEVYRVTGPWSGSGNIIKKSDWDA